MAGVALRSLAALVVVEVMACKSGRAPGALDAGRLATPKDAAAESSIDAAPDARVDGHDARVDGHDARVDGHDARVDGHDARVDAGAPDASTSPEAGPTPATTPGCGATPGPSELAGSTLPLSLSVDGMERTALVHAPPRYDGATPMPLVLMLHGGGGSGSQFERASGMNAVADAEDFVVVYPDGTGPLRTWNAGGCCGAAVRDGIDDVAFIDALLTHLESELCLDPRRFYVAGMSNGAMMSHRLACERSGRFAAAGPVAGTNVTETCTPARAPAVLQVHGSDDTHVPWQGGEGCGLAGVPFTSVPDSMEGWRERNGCSARQAPYFEMGDGSCVSQLDCAEGSDVVLCTVEGGGHSWPGGNEPPLVGLFIGCTEDGVHSQSFDVDALLWRFFREHMLR